jgi:hypothetical protein
MVKQERDTGKQKVAKETVVKDIVEREQYDKDGDLVCPACKKSLRGLKTNVSDSLIAPEKHTTKRRRVQCCSEACTAQFHEVQQKSLEDE